MTKVNSEIMFDPHVAGCCVISPDESQATTVRDTLTEWLGLSTSSQRPASAIDGPQQGRPGSAHGSGSSGP
jgi:hypothetical protein